LLPWQPSYHWPPCPLESVQTTKHDHNKAGYLYDSLIKSHFKFWLLYLSNSQNPILNQGLLWRISCDVKRLHRILASLVSPRIHVPQLNVKVFENWPSRPTCHLQWVTLARPFSKT
jgi:hypothetical protein